MKFYCVTFRDESCPESIGFSFHRTKRDAEKAMRECCPRTAPCQRCEEMGWEPTQLPAGKQCGRCGSWSPFSDEEPELEILEFSGTPKQMVWAALNHQVIS